MTKQNKNRFTHIVTESESGLPYKSIIKKKFSFSTRLFNKIKRQNLFKVNGIEKKLFLEASTGEKLEISLPKETSNFPPQKNIPIIPIYEDDDLLIVDKPHGYVVHPTHTYLDNTMVNGLMQYMNDTSQEFKIRLVNRLDMDTSGLLCFAKNSHAQDSLVKQMSLKKVKKKYVALLEGIVEDDNFTIDLPIGRPSPIHVRREVMEDGQPSITHIKVIERFEEKNNYLKDHTLVEIILETGRTHQIRVHTSHIGHPIAGDDLYGGSLYFINRQALHAEYFSFYQPVSGKFIETHAPINEDILNAIKNLSVTK